MKTRVGVIIDHKQTMTNHNVVKNCDVIIMSRMGASEVDDDNDDDSYGR